MEAGLDQVFGEEVPDQVEKGVQAADLLVFGSCGGPAAPQFGVPRMDSQHQNDPQDGGDYGGGHVVDHGSAAHPATGAGVQTGEP